MIEQVISHFKNWTIMHTDYRRPLKTFVTGQVHLAEYHYAWSGWRAEVTGMRG
jgi:hypothetical protein